MGACGLSPNGQRLWGACGLSPNGCRDPADGVAYSFLTAGLAAGLAQSCLATE